MIRTKGLTTTATCGRSKDKGTLAIGNSPMQINGSFALTVQQLVKELPIDGRPITSSEVQELPSILIEFFRVESVDTMIEALQRVKKSLENPGFNYHLAC